ncbi:LamG-like jellyroll fold domain-containing protein [Variovorax sp. GT1P44]|uniref:LamG-like jellyroll fold domain-containing protein n=1 Tax=Variovorax sp. GT1P44 TaxID=3443742 RepID=UPI003F46D838
MAAHRYWRAVGLEAYGLAGLDITEFQLLAGTTRVDASASLTSSVAPTTGALANLKDNDTSTGAAWSASALKSLVLNWDFGGSPQDVTDICIGANADATKFLLLCRLQYSDDATTWTPSTPFVGITWPGSKTRTSSAAPLEQIVLHFNGTNGSTTFTEVGGKTVTRAGSTLPTISTTQSKFGAASGAFVAGNVSVPHAAIPGDFTAQIQFYWDGTATTTSRALFTIGANGINLELYLKPTTHALSLFTTPNGTITLAGPAQSPTANSWNTATLERSNGQLSIYLNTVFAGGISYPNPLPAGTLTIGQFNTGNDSFTGYLDEFFLFNGEALGNGEGVSIPATEYAISTGQRIVRNTVRGRTAPALSMALPSAASVPTTFGAGAPVVRPLRGRTDYISGVLGQGVGRISGTTRKVGIPNNVPVRVRVRLVRERDFLPMRETWSDPITGAYSFDYVDELQTYTVVAFDHTHDERAVVGDNLTPTIIN